MRRRGTWRSDERVVHKETGLLRVRVGGWTMLMWCGVEAEYGPSYRFTRGNVNCMTCLVKEKR